MSGLGTRTCGYSKKVTSREEEKFKEKLRRGRGNAAAVSFAAAIGHPDGKHVCNKKVSLPARVEADIKARAKGRSDSRPEKAKPPLKPREIDELYHKACKHKCMYCEESFS